MTLTLSDIRHCLVGVVPAAFATTDADGMPNVTYVSHVYFVDEGRVALSRQFFNKTRRNLDENPEGCVLLLDPVTFDAYRLRLRFVRSETSGPLFDTMTLRIEAIASHSGMSGVFKLAAADVFDVVSIDPVEGFHGAQAPDEEPVADGPRNEIRGLQAVSDRINRARDLESLLAGTLETMEHAFGFEHSMVLLADESGLELVTLASRGYGEDGVGATVRVGEGLLGTVAAQRRMLRLSFVDADLRYGRTIRERVAASGDESRLRPEIPLPGLRDAESQLVVPLVLEDRLVGVLAVESRDPLAFEQWHEAFLEIIGNQIALGIDRMMERANQDEREDASASARPSLVTVRHGATRHTFCFYKNDDCVFVDGEYLIRNVPGKILWKILTQWSNERRTEFSNRELRLDPSLGLPPLKDNLESRLILLRRRLEQKCPSVRLVPTRRGRFALELDATVELVERESA